MINLKLKHGLLALAFSSTMFLLSCGNDSDDGNGGGGTAEVSASFTFSIDEETGGIVTFTNTSENADSYVWDFDDETSSTQENPVKTYTADGEYMVTLTATNEGGSDEAMETVTIELIVDMSDTEAPVITLLGDAEVEIEIGEEYVDAGAEANDNVDMDISDQIVVGGDEVNTLQPGEYTITYNVEDAAGNAATQVNRTVTVTYDPGLLTNGDFEAGDDPWFVNFGEGDPPPLPLTTNGGNTFFEVNIASGEEDPDGAFNVNLSQVAVIGQTNTYRLSFTAGSDRARTIIAGIGLNGGSFASSSEVVTLAVGDARYEVDLVADTWGTVEGVIDSRVLFDLLGDFGVVTLDNISLELLEEGDGVAGGLPIDFEDGRSLSGVFEGNVGGEVIANPDATGINTSGNVYAYTKGAGAQWFSGMFHLIPNGLSDGDGEVFTIKAWSPNAGVTIRMNLEKDDGSAPAVSIDQTISAANTWEEITYDFSSSGVNWAAGYDKIVIFPDWDAGNQVPVAETAIYYVDDITQGDGSGGGGDCPEPTGGEFIQNGDFETGDDCGWTLGGEPGNFSVTDAQANGGTYSAYLQADVDALGGGGASFYTIKAANMGVGDFVAGEAVTVSFDIFGSLEGAGGVVFVELFSEFDGGGATNEILGGGPIFPTGTWTSYSFDTTLGADVDGGVSVQLKVDCGANAGCVVNAYFDNVSLTRTVPE